MLNYSEKLLQQQKDSPLHIHTHTHTCAMWSSSHSCLWHWLTLTTKHTKDVSHRTNTTFISILHILSLSHKRAHTHTPTHTQPFTCPPLKALCFFPFVWVVIVVVTLSPSFHVKYIVLSLLPPSLPSPLLLHPPVAPAWGGVKLSVSLCLQKCPFFRCSRKL